MLRLSVSPRGVGYSGLGLGKCKAPFPLPPAPKCQPFQILTPTPFPKLLNLNPKDYEGDSLLIWPYIGLSKQYFWGYIGTYRVLGLGLPKINEYHFWGPYKEDYSALVFILGYLLHGHYLLSD